MGPRGQFTGSQQLDTTEQLNLSHSFSSINLFIFVYFRLHWVFVAACELSPVAASRSYSLSVVLRFLIVVASRVRSTGSRARAQQL